MRAREKEEKGREGEREEGEKYNFTAEGNMEGGEKNVLLMSCERERREREREGGREGEGEGEGEVEGEKEGEKEGELDRGGEREMIVLITLVRYDYLKLYCFYYFYNISKS